MKYHWLKFRVTEEEYREAKKSFIDSGERWFWRWCQKLFVSGVSEQRRHSALNVPQNKKLNT